MRLPRSQLLSPCKCGSGLPPGWWWSATLIGSGEAQERDIVGETPNLAARLQGIAEPNTVVIAESTRRLLGNLFELRGPRAKGTQGDRRAGARLWRRCGQVPSRAASRRCTPAA